MGRIECLLRVKPTVYDSFVSVHFATLGLTFVDVERV